MAIFVDADTKVIVQGLTGGQGKFHGLRNRDYGTQVVGGVTPGKGGQDVEGIPVFDSVAEAVAATGADRLVRRRAARRPRRRRSSRRPRPASAFVVCITEGIPAQDEAQVFNTLVRDYPEHPPARPELPRHHQPRQVQHRHHRRRDRPAADGRRPQRRHRQPLRHAHLPGAVRAASRTASACRRASASAATRCPGTSFIDCLAEFQADPETHAIIMIGEIGGSAEEEAAEFITANVTKPMSAYIAGVTAPAGKKMGHAGAIVSGGKGTAQGKMDALRRRRRAGRAQPDRGRRADGRASSRRCDRRSVRSAVGAEAATIAASAAAGGGGRAVAGAAAAARRRRLRTRP